MKNIKEYRDYTQQNYGIYHKRYECSDIELFNDLNKLDYLNVDYTIYFNYNGIVIVYVLFDNLKHTDVKTQNTIFDMKYSYNSDTNKMYLGLNIEEIEKELSDKHDHFTCISSDNISKIEHLKLLMKANKFNI